MYPKCNFCSSEYSDELFHNIYPNAENSILYKTKNFYISIDGYPVCENHLLIVPFDHTLSFSTLNRDTSNELEELIKYITVIKYNCENYIIFEHGSNIKKEDKRSFGNAIVHSHLHFIPAQKISKELIKNYCFEKDETKLKLKNGIDHNKLFYKYNSNKNFLDFLYDDLPTNEPYLFLLFNYEEKDCLCINESIIDGQVPSQYFRILFAIFMNPKNKNPFFNWKIQSEVQKSQNYRINIINNIFLRFK